MPFDSPLSAYQDAVQARGFVADPAQLRAVQALQQCHEALHQGRDAPRGVYLWGPVGRGKTWLMDAFYQSLKVPARRQHFHHFMGWVHQRSFQLTGTADPLHALAHELSQDVRVLCFDELFVNDIGDAIILGRLFQVMFEQGVVVVSTSNQPPQQLYADGFNRERFLPAHCGDRGPYAGGGGGRQRRPPSAPWRRHSALLGPPGRWPVRLECSV